jgi:hypothetical protein
MNTSPTVPRRWLARALRFAIGAAGLVLLAPPVRAEEGLWTFNRFPAAAVAARHGFNATPEWLDHLRLSALRLAGGCSASLVSAQGLVMTNHHCVRDCIESLSGLAKKDFARDGFLARTPREELRCQGIEANQLLAIDDVSARLREATQGLPPEQFAAALKAAIARIESACATGATLRCEVVSLYQGGRYDLYTYRRLQDLRLVFAPEDAIANFGGDPDNFMFPRYNLDLAFLRAYAADGRPLAAPQHLRWAAAGAREGELSFVAGHPGRTARGYTLAQLADERDQRLPAAMLRLAELRGFLAEYQQRGAEQRRHSMELLLDIENGLKSLRGQHAALADGAFFAQLERSEVALRARVAALPAPPVAPDATAGAAAAERFDDVWDRVATVVARSQVQRTALNALERSSGSTLFSLARGLVRFADESTKPNAKRLREYSDARLPEFRQRVLEDRPYSAEFETALLAFSLTRLREDLGPDHPLVQRLFARSSPADLARATVRGTRLKERQRGSGKAWRQALLAGGPAAIRASKDPMLELARAFDADARAARQRWETEVDGPLRQQQERLARARFAADGDAGYPDANFTLRLSVGAVRGWVDAGRAVAPFTLTGGAFARHTGAEPFALPPSWLKARGRLNAATPFNFVTDNDILGGNSGSPVVNAQAEVVGLVFDGNIHSLGGDYGFDAARNRAVAVHASAVLESLAVVYGAQALVNEITASAAPAAASAAAIGSRD